MVFLTCTCVVGTRKDYGHLFFVPHYLLLPTSVSALTQSTTKEVKIINRSAFPSFFHESVGTSAGKVAKRVPFCRSGGWCSIACFEINHKGIESRVVALGCGWLSLATTAFVATWVLKKLSWNLSNC